jgi:predicted TIM-barrel fold metal-dependent hydrolase
MARKYVVVDAQFHHLPLEAVKKLEEEVSEEGKRLLARFRNPQINTDYRKVFDIAASISHMEDCGVDMALVGLANWNGAGLNVCKAVNDGLARLVKEYPGKFIPLAHVPCLGGQATIDELERAINELGLKGVTVMTSQRDIRLDDKQLRPFFRKISQLGIPVEVHPTVKMPIWGGEKYFMSGSVSREYEIIKSFVEVLSGVLPEFPDVNFLFAHYGGGVPFLLGRIMSWHTPGNGGVPEEKIGLPKTIREFEDLGLKKGFNQLLDRIYFDMAGTGGWMPAVKQALLVIKPERLCFASDYPWEMSRPGDLKAYIAGTKKLNIPEQNKAKILGGNIRKLFKA